MRKLYAITRLSASVKRLLDVIAVSWRRLKAVWPWLVEARHVWLALAVIAAALAISVGPLSSERVIRLTGLALQVLGIGTVAWGISETRALFGHPSFVSKIKVWLGRFSLSRRTQVIAVGGVESHDLAGKARLHATHVAKTPTVEARVEALEKNVTAIHTRITETQKEMDEGFGKAAEALKLERHAREEEDKASRSLRQLAQGASTYLPLEPRGFLSEWC